MDFMVLPSWCVLPQRQCSMLFLYSSCSFVYSVVSALFGHLWWVCCLAIVLFVSQRFKLPLFDSALICLCFHHFWWVCNVITSLWDHAVMPCYMSEMKFFLHKRINTLSVIDFFGSGSLKCTYQTWWTHYTLITSFLNSVSSWIFSWMLFYVSNFQKIESLVN